jgi:hypothetical protein
MAITVVGSVAFDTVETPAGRIDRCLAGAATYFSLAASYFTDVRVIGVVGEDFTARKKKPSLRLAASIFAALSAPRQELLLAGLVPRKSERSQDSADRSECLRLL